jgi:phosphoribosylformylglycinamidine (FGAM) synthase PurS component
MASSGFGEPEEEVEDGELEEASEVEQVEISKKANIGDIKAQAKQKLEEELKKAKDKSFADPVISYLLKRCGEDSGLSEDVMQEHKTWEKCFDYIYAQARKQSKGSRCAVRDEVVYEWAEDYYHKDDKKEEEEKARKEAEKKAKKERNNAENKESTKTNKTNDELGDENPYEKVEKTYEMVMEEKPNKTPKQKKAKEVEGQMDLFSMMDL